MKNIGSLNIHKGEIGASDKRLAAWDAIPECDEDCKLYETCPYDKTKTRCNLRKSYIENILKTLTKSVKDPDPITLIRIGMLLVPLFNNLIDLKIEKHTKRGRVMGMKGNISPVMKEMRETIKQVDSMLLSMGVQTPGNTKGSTLNNLLHGDSSYYDEMIGGGGIPA